MELEFRFGNEKQQNQTESVCCNPACPAPTSQPSCHKCPIPAQPPRQNPCLEPLQGQQTQSEPEAVPGVSRAFVGMQLSGEGTSPGTPGTLKAAQESSVPPAASPGAPGGKSRGEAAQGCALGSGGALRPPWPPQVSQASSVSLSLCKTWAGLQSPPAPQLGLSSSALGLTGSARSHQCPLLLCFLALGRAVCACCPPVPAQALPAPSANKFTPNTKGPTHPKLCFLPLQLLFPLLSLSLHPPWSDQVKLLAKILLQSSGCKFC